MGEYWRMWNLPMHNWFYRHLYNPMLKKGIPKQVVIMTVFLISALGHEYLVYNNLFFILFKFI